MATKIVGNRRFAWCLKKDQCDQCPHITGGSTCDCDCHDEESVVE